MLGETFKTEAKTVRMIKKTGINEKINPNEQAAALSQRRFSALVDTERYMNCENLLRKRVILSFKLIIS